MKRIAFVFFQAFISLVAFSQAKPSYTQYILNNYLLNPAVAGIENYTDVKLGYRDQWSGINGAPVTGYFSIHGPIGKTDFRTTATSFEVPGENPRGKQYLESYTAADAHHGVGFTAINDKAGYISRWSVSGSYAYHKPLGVKTTLSAGFNAGITSVYLDRSKINFADLDPNDPAIGYSSGELKQLKPEVGAGLWLYSASYFMGIAVQNIVPGKSKFVANGDYGTYYTPNFFFTAGYRFPLTDEINMLPSLMIQAWEPQLYGVHTNVKMQYMDKLWIGAGYRFSDLLGGYSAMAGVNISNSFNISYAYEGASNSRLSAYAKNTHELVVGFLLGNKYGDTCPRNVW